KPLEVLCAEHLLAEGWSAWLGSHFADNDTIRELDVLAEKSTWIDYLQVTCKIRLLLSCKGFPREWSPVSYSVSRSHVPGIGDHFLSSHRARFRVQESEYGPIPNLESDAASHFMLAAALADTRPVVAFDVFERIDGKPTKPSRSSATTYKRRGDGDRRIFEG